MGVKFFGASLGTVELVRRRFALHHVVVELVRHDDGLAGKRISRELEDDVLAQSQTGGEANAFAIEQLARKSRTAGIGLRIRMEQQLGITGAEGTSFGAHELLDAFGGSIGRFTDAAKDGDLGICRLHGMQHALDRLGIDVIVGVHKKDGLALDGIDTGISSARNARVFLVNHQYAIVGLRDLVQHVQRIIGRTVVDADNLNRALGLGQQRIEASLNGTH